MLLFCASNLITDKNYYPSGLRVYFIMSLKSLLHNMGLYFAWDNQNIMNHNTFLHMCKQRLQNLYLTKWNDALSASSDGLIYKS